MIKLILILITFLLVGCAHQPTILIPPTTTVVGQHISNAQTNATQAKIHNTDAGSSIRAAKVTATTIKAQLEALKNEESNH